MTTGNGSIPNEGKTDSGEYQKWSCIAVVLGMVLLTLAIFYVWLRVQQIRAGYRLARFQVEYRELYDLNRKLQLEWSSLHDPSYLERLGRDQLGLGPPRADQQIYMPPSKR